jgi:hypothetical protein
MPDRKLLTWIEPHGDNDFVVAFVGGGARKRKPATRRFKSREECQQWVEREAERIDLLPADSYRASRAEAFDVWQQDTCAQYTT